MTRRKNGGPRLVQGPPRKEGKAAVKRSTEANGSRPARTEPLALKDGICPRCGNAKLDVSPKPPGSRTAYYVGCWPCEEELGRNNFPAALAAVVEDCPNGAALLEDPLRYLAHCFSGPARRLRTADEVPPPSRAKVEGWHERLFTDDGKRGRAYLRKRGVSEAVMRAVRIGWDGDRRCLTFPFWCDGEVVGLKTRKPRDGAKMMNLRGKGRRMPLYPEPDAPDGWILLVEGELDALCAISAGLPATSVTLGAGTWQEEWADDLADLRVAVCFDVGAEECARKRVKQLRTAGVRARRLDLRELGMTEEGDDLSDYLTRGGSVAAIRHAVLRRGRVRSAA